MMKWLERLKLRWALRGSTTSPMSTGALPGTEQRAEETAAQKFKREHGFSEATTPMPWSEDISKHNAAIDKEYREEVERRRFAYLCGEYKPQFVDTSDMTPDRIEDLRNGATPGIDEINWHLEMTLSPGRRVNVTADIGVPVQPVLSDIEHFEARMAGSLGREVAAIERGKAPAFKTARDFIGSRESILAAVGDNEAVADQVEANARKMFGVEDLDAPLPENQAEVKG